jgi:transcription elongation factor SPT4
MSNDEFEDDTVPIALKQLRACMVCSLVKTTQQFVESGCENCRALDLAGDQEKVEQVTSPSFEGLIGVNDMDVSWVRTWQQLPATYVRGCYAVSVNGTLPRAVLSEVRSKRLPLVSRNRQHELASLAAPPPDRDASRAALTAVSADDDAGLSGAAASTAAEPIDEFE